MNAVLRGTILYAGDMYYNLKESELRQIERIEENYMRKVLKTTKGCPITSLYLALGQIPARFEIMKMRLLYLKYILEQPEDSTISKLFKLQLEKPKKGDWASSCQTDIQNIKLEMTLKEIKAITKIKYKTIVKEKIRKTALEYLLNKQGKKGRENKYLYLEMEDYLLPFNDKQTIEQKCEMFAIKH